MTWDDVFILIFRVLLHLLNATARTKRAAELTVECEKTLKMIEVGEIEAYTEDSDGI